QARMLSLSVSFAAFIIEHNSRAYVRTCQPKGCCAFRRAHDTVAALRSPKVGGDMGSLRTIAVALAAVAICGGSAAEENTVVSGYTDIVWRVRPLPATPDNEPKTAAIGTFLFVQDFAPASEAVLTQPLNSETPGPIWSAPLPHVTNT